MLRTTRKPNVGELAKANLVRDELRHDEHFVPKTLTNASPWQLSSKHSSSQLVVCIAQTSSSGVHGIPDYHVVGQESRETQRRIKCNRIASLGCSVEEVERVSKLHDGSGNVLCSVANVCNRNG